MGRVDIIRRIRESMPEIEGRFGVVSLSLFGSAGRDELHEHSDVDVLVEFDAPTRFRNYFALKEFLESLVGRKVDLVTSKALRPELRPHIEKDLVHVA